ncbi:energy-coupling factor ABC transporter substrate-binding protein [Zhaonella formicivorans]|jgi:cobalt/nickel transport protein|uniref:energy-coupling factor ABC transporter substrate-binding protein n=1 Tax=Zhaonella formicivorans TaxID=2528593 RepID=UPI0010DEDC12|nr:energy-coupling factor ABC transporter substrate-binding protein [Zhaonella formicivorans]
MSTTAKNMMLILLVIILAVVPLLLKSGAEFGGADGQAEAVISELNPEYQAWASPIWEPPSGEIESLLFALQAALGAGFIGYYIGASRAKAKNKGNI